MPLPMNAIEWGRDIALATDGTIYYLEQTYHPTDYNLIRKKVNEYTLKWNQKHGRRFYIIETTVSLETGPIVIKGRAEKSESFNQLRMDQFWGQHLHIEGIADKWAYYYGLGGGGGTGGEPPSQPNPPAISSTTGIIGIVLILIIGFWLYKKFKGSK